MSKPSLVILAAGMGSRYGGLKQLDRVGPSGETIMDYSIYDALKAGFNKVVFIIREQFRTQFELEIVKRYENICEVALVEQELHKIPEQFTLNDNRVKPWGTGHALLMAEPVIDAPFAVINADDYYGQNSFKELANHLTSLPKEGGEFSMVGFSLPNTLSKSGSVSRGVCSVNDSNYLSTVDEHHKVERDGEGDIYGVNSKGERVILEEKSIVSMNMWGFSKEVFQLGNELFSSFLESDGDREESEFYINYIVNEFILNRGGRCKVLQTDDQWFGVTYKEDKELVVEQLAKFSSDGLYPSTLFINR